MQSTVNPTKRRGIQHQIAYLEQQENEDIDTLDPLGSMNGSLRPRSARPRTASLLTVNEVRTGCLASPA